MSAPPDQPTRPSLHLIQVRPVMVRNWSDELNAWVRRTVGYVAACSCGWGGRTQDTYALANVDGAAHRRDPGV